MAMVQCKKVNHMKFTEAQLEAAIIEFLGESGYPHVPGETIDRAFCVISDGVNNKAGSFFAPYEFFSSTPAADGAQQRDLHLE